jgi:hypothetical protein
LCKRTAQRIGVYVVDETPPALDLHDRDPLPVSRLELGIAVDRDLPQLEAELVVCRRDDAPCRRAEVAARSREEDDFSYG